MSTYKRETKHPITGEWGNATWMDDYFGQHRYGIKFDGEETVFKENEYEWETRDDLPLEQPIESWEERFSKEWSHITEGGTSSFGISHETRIKDFIRTIEKESYERGRAYYHAANVQFEDDIRRSYGQDLKNKVEKIKQPITTKDGWIEGQGNKVHFNRGLDKVLTLLDEDLTK
jgi:5-methylcytosine-specific restriction endonuclease McrBC GTP-binding regulatory subunit McrB